MDYLKTFIAETWTLAAEMAPYLLLGFVLAGFLSVLLRREWVQRVVGGLGTGPVIRASLVGVPMPLCSCSVIPVTAALREAGAGRGATVSFLASTPQTGVDSILATWSLLGGFMTAVRVAVAFVSGFLAGVLINLFPAKAAAAPRTQADGKTDTGEDAGKSEEACHAAEKTTQAGSCCQGGGGTEERAGNWLAKTRSALRYGLMTLPVELGRSLGIGLVLAGLFATFLPPTLFTGALGAGPLAYLVVTLGSVPLYVCATGSIPVAVALIGAGLSPGAALVFLVAGPATNAATISIIWGLLGRTATFVYLGVILAVSWTAGGLMDLFAYEMALPDGSHGEAGMIPGWLGHLSAVILLALLLRGVGGSLLGRLRGEPSTAPGCCDEAGGKGG